MYRHWACPLTIPLPGCLGFTPPLQLILLMQLLITGAAGFLGGRLAKALAAQGYTVRATSRRTHRTTELTAQGATFLPGDLTDPLTCQQVVAGCDAVIHCAALSAPWGPYQAFYQANVRTTYHLLDAAQAAGVRRFLNIGTPSIYANFQDRLNVHEGSPLPRHLINHYAATKLAAENEVLRRHQPGFATLSLRPRAIIGAEDQVIFPRLIRAYQAGRLRIIGRGDNLASLSSVPNLVQAMHSALQAPVAHWGRAYNLADPQPVPLWEAINYVLSALGHAPVSRHVPYPMAMTAATLAETMARLRGSGEPTLTRYGISVLARSFTLDPWLAQRQLGYSPALTSWQGLEEFIAWYQAEATDARKNSSTSGK